MLELIKTQYKFKMNYLSRIPIPIIDNICLYDAASKRIALIICANKNVNSSIKTCENGSYYFKCVVEFLQWSLIGNIFVKIISHDSF